MAFKTIFQAVLLLVILLHATELTVGMVVITKVVLVIGAELEDTAVRQKNHG